MHNVELYELADTNLKNKIIEKFGYDSGNILENELLKKTILNIEETDNTDNADKILLIGSGIIQPNILKTKKGALIKNFVKMTKKDSQIVAIGLSARCPINEMNPKIYAKQLEPELIDLLKTLSERGNQLGVQGDFTADVLKAIGIKNVNVIGNPIFYANGKNPPKIVKKGWNNSLRPVYCGKSTSLAEYNIINRLFINKTFALNDPKIILQTEFNVIPYILYNENPQKYLKRFSADSLETAITEISLLYGFSEFEISFNKTIKNLFKIFLNTNDWISFLKTRDFSYGNSVSGNLAALALGIPSLLLVDDSETYEISKLFDIPHLFTAGRDYNDFSLKYFYEKSDYSKIQKNYKSLFLNYENFLKSIGLTASTINNQTDYFLHPSS